MNFEQELLYSTLSHILVRESTANDYRDGSDDEMAKAPWQALIDAEMAGLGVPEDIGGSGGDLGDVFVLLQLAGRYGVPLPLAEGTILGGWLLERGGLHLPEGPISVPVHHSKDSLVLEQGRASGRLHWIPWGATVSRVIAIAETSDGPRVVILDPLKAEASSHRNVAGESRDSLFFKDTPLLNNEVGAVVDDIQVELLVRGALSRIILMAGALETIFEMTVEYANQRKQFGRAILSFQAVGNRMSQLCSEAELGVLAAKVATERFRAIGMEAAFEVAAARSTLVRAASSVSAHAHQIHGAIGMTQEYPLHRFTRRLWAWQHEWGSERHWCESLGFEISNLGVRDLWPRLTKN